MNTRSGGVLIVLVATALIYMAIEIRSLRGQVAALTSRVDAVAVVPSVVGGRIRPMTHEERVQAIRDGAHALEDSLVIAEQLRAEKPSRSESATAPTSPQSSRGADRRPAPPRP